MSDKQPLNSKHSKVDRSKADLILPDPDKQRGSKFIENRKSNIFRSGITSKVIDVERFRFMVKIYCYQTVKGFGF